MKLLIVKKLCLVVVHNYTFSEKDELEKTSTIQDLLIVQKEKTQFNEFDKALRIWNI